MLTAFPRLEAGCYPTPLREMSRLRQHLGAKPRLWIKHDDWIGPAFGGNKIRKLEYVLADALERGVTDIITTGAVTSNHCRATAGLCVEHGLRCHLVLNVPPGWSPDAPHQSANFELDRLYGARIIPVIDRDQRAPEMERVAATLRAQGFNPLVVPLGASFPLGALGFVRAAGELADQAQGLNLRAVFHASSSGGTQAGLLVGAQRAGLERCRIVGISADQPRQALTEIVFDIAFGASALIGAPAPARSSIHVDDTQVGGGYGIPTTESSEAIELLARLEGVILDPVYTAKAMAAFLKADIPAGSDIIFWHTGGQPALFQSA